MGWRRKQGAKPTEYLSGAFQAGLDPNVAAQEARDGGDIAVKVLDGLVTPERVSGSVIYLAVPEAYAFYAEHIDPGPTNFVLALPQWAFDLVDSGWASGPSPENGCVMLWEEGQPPDTDVVVPLLPTQASAEYRVPPGFTGRRA